MDDKPATASPPSDTPPDHAQRGVLPGVAMAMLILGGVGAFAYAGWRETHPAAEVPEGVEPMLKVPGEIPGALRKAPTGLPGRSQR